MTRSMDLSTAKSSDQVGKLALFLSNHRVSFDLTKSKYALSSPEANYRQERKKTVIGLDILILAIVSTTAITLVGFAAKAYDIVRKDWHRG